MTKIDGSGDIKVLHCIDLTIKDSFRYWSYRLFSISTIPPPSMKEMITESLNFFSQGE